MITVLIMLFIILAITIFAFMLRDANHGVVPLISIKNIFLLGFVVFQVTSPITTLVAGGSEIFPLSFLEKTGMKMFVWATLFYITFQIAYPRLPLIAKISRMVPVTRFQPGNSMLITMSMVLTVMGIVLHFGVMLPLVSVLANFLAISFAAIACGMIGWVWAPRLHNPVVGLMSVSIILVNMANVLTGTFGRRTLLAILACLVWGMFYSWWRHFNPTRTVVTMLVIGFVPVMLLALFTSARESGEHDRSAAEQLRAVISDGSVTKGLLLLADGQSAGGNAMWCLEKFPESYPTNFAFTAKYAFMLPVPRSIWHSKPMPLSRNLPTLAMMQGVARDKLSIGPGIIGHAAADGGIFLVFIYAVMLAYICRGLDLLVLGNIYNPLIVLPIGSALGHTLGIARGESGVFVFIMLFSITLSYLSLVISAKCVDYLGLSKNDDGDQEYQEYEEYQEYGDEYEELPESP